MYLFPTVPWGQCCPPVVDSRPWMYEVCSRQSEAGKGSAGLSVIWRGFHTFYLLGRDMCHKNPDTGSNASNSNVCWWRLRSRTSFKHTCRGIISMWTVFVIVSGWHRHTQDKLFCIVNEMRLNLCISLGWFCSHEWTQTCEQSVWTQLKWSLCGAFFPQKPV